ncbi:MAG: PD40 domain-containing protein [Candidatus Pacebacteria bacterium]|jgi:Tol biopolymer transport system component|nr:PD40 domain-containing protein [Candidatus Paceibacterota bacterium]
MKIFSRISAFLFIVTLLGFSNFVFAAPSLPIPADPLTNGFELVNVDSDEVKGNGDANNDVFGISSDGRYVIFNSAATNLVADDTNGVTDIFVRDMESGITLRVSVDSEGNEANNHSGDASISSDGRYVAFSSNASNLVVGDSNGLGDIFVYDRDTDTIERVSIDSEGLEGNNTSVSPSISADGRYVIFDSDATNLVGDDTNGAQDIFVYDQ